MVGLQQIEAVGSNQIPDAANVADVVDFLSDDGCDHGLAGTVGHRTDQTCDGDQGSRFALTPSHMAAGRNSHQQCILAAISNVQDFRHGKIIEVNRIDFHKTDPGVARIPDFPVNL